MPTTWKKKNLPFSQDKYLIWLSEEKPETPTCLTSSMPNHSMQKQKCPRRSQTNTNTEGSTGIDPHKLGNTKDWFLQQKTGRNVSLLDLSPHMSSYGRDMADTWTIFKFKTGNLTRAAKPHTQVKLAQITYFVKLYTEDKMRMYS